MHYPNHYNIFIKNITYSFDRCVLLLTKRVNKTSFDERSKLDQNSHIGWKFSCRYSSSRLRTTITSQCYYIMLLQGLTLLNYIHKERILSERLCVNVIQKYLKNLIAQYCNIGLNEVNSRTIKLKTGRDLIICNAQQFIIIRRTVFTRAHEFRNFSEYINIKNRNILVIIRSWL